MHRFHFVFRHELGAQLGLVRRRLIKRIKKVFTRPDVALRMTMTVETPSHIKSVGPPGNRHLADRTVACGAADAFLQVNAVVEIDKLRERIHSSPFERPVRLKT